MIGEHLQALERLAALLSGPGQELLARLGDEVIGAGSELALAERLRREYPAALVAAAMAQHELRLAARAKFSRAMHMLFTRAGLEQASSEAAARHRAARYGGMARIADLCCGIGGDLCALAAAGGAASNDAAGNDAAGSDAAGNDAAGNDAAGRDAAGNSAASADRLLLAVDTDVVHARMALHNASVYGGAGQGLRACVADVRELRLAGMDAVFVDPARRTSGGRFRAGVSEPPLDWCIGLAATLPAVGIKAAPGLPSGLIPAGWEAEFVAVGRDLKEAVLWSPALATASRRATILPAGDTLIGEPGPDVAVAGPGEYLLDPSPAVTRAGLVQDLGRRLGAWQIDPRIAFLSADHELRTPFGRSLRVIESAPWNERDFARRLRTLGIGVADLRRRGLAGDVDQIHRRLRLSGPRHAVLVLTRANGRPWGLICSPEPDAASGNSDPPGPVAGGTGQRSGG